MKSRRRATFRLVFGILIVTVMIVAQAWAANEKVLHTFTYGKEGANPVAPLIIDAAGNLYGTSRIGGPYNAGTVFELIPKSSGRWTERILYSFKWGADGAQPQAALTLDSKGNLYGTAALGGGLGGSSCSGNGCGTVFKLTRGLKGKWTESVVYAFAGGADGQYPVANLIADDKGNLYGTTLEGEVSIF